MVVCEQFIFTAAKIDGNEGYQVIAKSKGISHEIVQNLREYLFPLGINEDEFHSSKSLIDLGKNQITYSIVKNIGVGYDGRRGTLYNHTFVIEKKDFEELLNDSRIFDNYFIEDSSLRGELKTIQIKPVEIPPNFKVLNKLNPIVLKTILFRLFKKTKIALVKTDEIELIQNLLALFPPTKRVIPFSTLVNDPLRQHKYDIMQIPENAKNKLSKNIVVVYPENPKSTKLTGILGDFVEVLVDIILKENKSEWTKISNDYKKLSVQSRTIKRVKPSEIFNSLEYDGLANTEHYSQLKNKIKILYLSKKFRNASPRVMLDITKKIRKITKKSFKQQIQKNTKKQTLKITHLVSITAILLDCINHLDGYTEKKISSSTQSSIEFEKMKLIDMLNEYSPSQKSEYVFDPLVYAKAIYHGTVSYWQAIGALFFGR